MEAAAAKATHLDTVVSDIGVVLKNYPVDAINQCFEKGGTGLQTLLNDKDNMVKIQDAFHCLETMTTNGLEVKKFPEGGDLISHLERMQTFCVSHCSGLLQGLAGDVGIFNTEVIQCEEPSKHLGTVVASLLNAGSLFRLCKAGVLVGPPTQNQNP